MLMKSLTLLLCGLLFALAASAQEAPRFLQPSAEFFSDEEIALLGQAVEELDALLATLPWGSQMEHSERGWGSEQFARYTAGVLQSLGYRVTVVGRETDDETGIWLAVAVDLPTRTAWVPVDATPPEGEVQSVLGRIPWEGEPSSAWPSPFAADMMSYDFVLPIGENDPPIAKIDRTRRIAHEPGDSIWLSAFASVDPDGGIVLYVWDFGDGESLVSTTARVRHRFVESGVYSVRLTVIDDSGSHAPSEPTEITVVKPEESDSRRPASGCGCG
jgi:hypothetical protein